MKNPPRLGWTSTSHITSSLWRRPKVYSSKHPKRVKAINFTTKPLQGVARRITICWDWALKRMTWCNRLKFIYKLIYSCFLVSLYSICVDWKSEHIHSHNLHCTWLGCMMGSFQSDEVVHSWFMDLGTPFEIVLHYLPIGGMTYLSHSDGFLMVSALMYTFFGL